MAENGKGTRILIFDTDKKWAEDAANVLSEEGFSVLIETDDFKKCIKQVEQKKTMFAVAIINVHCLENMIKDLEMFTKASPITAVIISMEKEDQHALELFWPPKMLGTYPFGAKNTHTVGELPKLVTAHFQKYKMLPEQLKIDWQEGITKYLDEYSHGRTEAKKLREGLASEVLKDELTYIIKRLFSYDYDESTITDSVRVEKPGLSGHSVTGVLRITPNVIREVPTTDDTEKPKTKSVLLKFGPKMDIEQESFNYDRWVEWFLTHDQTVRKVGYAASNYYAGILYSYPREVQTGYIPFAEYIRNRPTSDCIALIEHMFHPSNKHWLSYNAESLLPKQERKLQEYYLKRVLHANLDEMRELHFMNSMAKTIDKMEKQLKKEIWSHDSVNDSYTFNDLNITVPNPLKYITIPDVDNLTITIIHGDLHGQNILVDTEMNRCYFIDFYYTGPGHIYRDFIELELSVRYDLFSSRSVPENKRLTSANSQEINAAGLNRLKRLEEELIKSACGGEEIGVKYLGEQEKKAFDIIKAIRFYARANCEKNFLHYYKGLIFSSLKGLKYFYPLDVRIHKFLISGMYVEVLQKNQLR